MTSFQDDLAGYRVYYKKQNDTSLSMFAVSVDADVLELEIKNLEKFTNYTIRIAGFSLSGNGLPSSAYSVKTDEDSKRHKMIEV